MNSEDAFSWELLQQALQVRWSLTIRTDTAPGSGTEADRIFLMLLGSRGKSRELPLSRHDFMQGNHRFATGRVDTVQQMAADVGDLASVVLRVDTSSRVVNTLPASMGPSPMDWRLAGLRVSGPLPDCFWCKMNPSL
ncbi:hypothetical protein HaLaN_24702 [Haematococcus lacustris]|uniref:PLAT domain-containing protein n=1 Tax=Haematococcus lacustris TaxID=44745 RepID=A0A699ZX24_HAELA|nr:hypothetical protein HaLaN_24702 [Haematococcus lacustris]